MTARDISRRLDRLDSARPVADRRVVWMKRKEDEPVAVAIARWCEAHPDEPPPVDDDNTLIIMHDSGPKRTAAIARGDDACTC
jgi:hypothetical protein